MLGRLRIAFLDIIIRGLIRWNVSYRSLSLLPPLLILNIAWLFYDSRLRSLLLNMSTRVIWSTNRYHVIFADIRDIFLIRCHMKITLSPLGWFIGWRSLGMYWMSWNVSRTAFIVEYLRIISTSRFVVPLASFGLIGMDSWILLRGRFVALSKHALFLTWMVRIIINV